MTLRARLTAAFLAVVLGPVLLGAVFVGVTVATVSRARSMERLDVAAGGVRIAVGAACRRLRSAAEMAALLTGNAHTLQVSPGATAADEGKIGLQGRRDDNTGPAGTVVGRQFAAAVVLSAVSGTPTVVAGVIPPYPWADCAVPGFGRTDGVPVSYGVAAVSPRSGERPGGLSVRVDIHDQKGVIVGYATAVDPVTGALVAELSDGSGAAVGILDAGTALSTERVTDVASVTAVARDLSRGRTGQTSTGRYVRRLDPEQQQPLTLVVSVRSNGANGLFLALVTVVLCAALLAVVAAWALARSTTRPLTQLAVAVDRVASGDLTARAPTCGQDEVGRLGETFNRMTRETQGYIQALTSSRDQLRGQLGVLGDTLSGTHDLDRILRVILQTATAATGAQAGVVLLVDSTGGILVGQCAEGLVGRGVPTPVTELRLRVGEGLLGGVAASGEPRRGRVERDGPVLTAHEPDCLTYVAVPFTAPAVGPTTGLEPPGNPQGIWPGRQRPEGCSPSMTGTVSTNSMMPIL